MGREGSLGKCFGCFSLAFAAWKGESDENPFEAWEAIEGLCE